MTARVNDTNFERKEKHEMPSNSRTHLDADQYCNYNCSRPFLTYMTDMGGSYSIVL